jgi:hypothetical protein
MGYLHPPPGDGPVIVMKDVGGDVRRYAAQTFAYIRSGREVRLHECRSACTLALAIPNVCVYPDSVLRFHKAYNPITKATNDGVTEAMMRAYPPAVRARLGVLTRKYKSLTGSELIRLGVRDCDTPAEPKLVIARASARPIGAENPLANDIGALFAGFGAPDIPVYGGYAAPVRVEQVKVRVAEAAPEAAAGAAETDTPAPPPRPTGLTAPPEPPFRPLAPASAPPRASRWGVPIRGSAPVLATARFAPFPYRLIRKS